MLRKNSLATCCVVEKRRKKRKISPVNMWSYFSELQKTSFLQHVWLWAIHEKLNFTGAPCHSLDFWVVNSCKEDIFPQNPFRLHKMCCLNQSIFYSRNHSDLKLKIIYWSLERNCWKEEKINTILVSHEQSVEKCDRTLFFSNLSCDYPEEQWEKQLN